MPILNAVENFPMPLKILNTIENFSNDVEEFPMRLRILNAVRFLSFLPNFFQKSF